MFLRLFHSIFVFKMMQDDVVYVILLVASLGFGHFIPRGIDVGQRQIIYSALGFLLTVIVSGVHALHPLFTTITCGIIIAICNKRYCHVVSFIFCFGYLVFFRTCHYLGLPSPPSHTNAIQMMLTLKMVGAAFECHEHWKATSSKSSRESTRTFSPTPIDLFHYAFCYAGVLTGPYYRYSTYWDMLHAPYREHKPSGTFVKRRLMPVPFYVVFFLISNYLFPVEFATSNEIMERSLSYRIFYMTPVFFSFRMRIYAGFVLGECVCMMSGLGIYPECSRPQAGAGPTDMQALAKFESDPAKWQHGHYSYEAIYNVDEYSSDFVPTIREGIRSWNKTVQYWLVVFVHKQLPFSRTVRMIVTMGTSAFWHGVHPGYYLCLMSAPLFLLAEQQVEVALKGRLGLQRQAILLWVWWLLKMQSFSYMGMAFLLLRVDSTLYFWKSIYFVGHLMAVLFLLIAKWVGPLHNHKKQPKEKPQ